MFRNDIITSHCIYGVIMANLQKMIKLTEEENKIFGDFIKKQRKLHITTPKDNAKNAYMNNKDKLETLLKMQHISQFIHQLRAHCFDEFLIEEANLNEVILSSLGSQFTIPRSIITELSKNLYNLKHQNIDEFTINLQNTFGEYIGHVTPYLYQLLLSNTQSRRSRAGKTFEGIIYFLYEHLNYSFDSQSKIGKQKFTNLGLGKVVDSILPSITAFEQRRNKTIVGSMKTTLRERWQEAVEELQRSNLPNIHLLTVDEDISTNKINQMAMHNIVLVVLKEIKDLPHCRDKRSVISFEEYFLQEIPTYLNYWKNNV